MPGRETLYAWPTTNAVRGVAWRRDGRPHVGLNVAATQCLLIRLGTLAHELRHVERLDLDRPGPEAEREADGRADGADVVRAAVVGVNRTAGVGTLATLECRHDGTAFLSLVSRTADALARHAGHLTADDVARVLHLQSRLLHPIQVAHDVGPPPC